MYEKGPASKCRAFLFATGVCAHAPRADMGRPARASTSQACADLDASGAFRALRVRPLAEPSSPRGCSFRAMHRSYPEQPIGVHSSDLWPAVQLGRMPSVEPPRYSN